MNKEASDKENIFGQGEPNTAFAQYFIGWDGSNVLGSMLCSDRGHQDHRETNA